MYIICVCVNTCVCVYVYDIYILTYITSIRRERYAFKRKYLWDLREDREGENFVILILKKFKYILKVYFQIVTSLLKWRCLIPLCGIKIMTFP